MARDRRTAEEIVKEIIDFLNTKDGLITRGELCKAVRINTETAEKWLKIGFMFRNQCPFFNLQKAGKLSVIKVIKKSH